jgi:hypothetical protein
MDESFLKIEEEETPSPPSRIVSPEASVMFATAAAFAIMAILMPWVTCPHGSVLHFGDQCIDLASLPRRDGKVEVSHVIAGFKVAFGFTGILATIGTAAFEMMRRRGVV